LTGFGAKEVKLRMVTTLPMQDQHNALAFNLGHDLLQHRAHDSFFELRIAFRVMPQGADRGGSAS
jgi:hypothetical protein